jgi:putative membrane protein
MNTTLRSTLLGLAAAAVATVAKGKAEEVLQPLGEKVLPPPPAKMTQIGADSAGHPENMPPSELADRVQHAVTGNELTDEQRQKVSVPLHWAMGLGFGAAYAVVAARVPAVRAGRGLAAGAALFATTHGSGLPAAGLQHPPWRMPAAWWVWEAGSHLIYGVALDSSLTALDRVVPQ